MDDVVYELDDVFLAFGGDGDDSAGAGGDFLDVGEFFSYLRTELGSAGSLVAMQTTGRVLSMRALGPFPLVASGGGCGGLGDAAGGKSPRERWWPGGGGCGRELKRIGPAR